MIEVRIENAYEDGHESTHTAIVPDPCEHQSLDEWFEEVVFDYTGDGHGIDDMGSWYKATITKAPVPEWIGQSYEW